MTSNRLIGPAAHGRKSERSALEWAASAKAKGLHQVAKQWEDAHAAGWDASHWIGYGR